MRTGKIDNVASADEYAIHEKETVRDSYRKFYRTSQSMWKLKLEVSRVLMHIIF